jgi:hypothetical protein
MNNTELLDEIIEKLQQLKKTVEPVEPYDYETLSWQTGVESAIDEVLSIKDQLPKH